MLNQTRENDIAMFAEISNTEDIIEPSDVPFSTLVPAFITSELKSAFSIGFNLYPVCNCRFSCCERIDVNGYDDVISNDDIYAV